MIPFLVLLALAASVLGPAIVYRRSLAVLLLTAGPIRFTADVATVKSAAISTVTTISADTTDPSTPYEVPRGAQDVSFAFEVSLNTGYVADTNYFKGYILGCDTPDGTFVRIPGLATGQLTTAGEVIPTAANAQGLTLPRFLKVEWDETGTMTSFTAVCRIRFNLPGGAGRQYAADYVGG